MDSHDKKKPIPLKKSFSFAIEGIFAAAQTERNMRIHLGFSIVVLAASFYFSITKIEWLIILITIGGMLALEMVNTAIERVVDLVTDEYHPLAKEAKDLAAGAVLLYAALSVIVGLIIFLPHLRKFL